MLFPSFRFSWPALCLLGLFIGAQLLLAPAALAARRALVVGNDNYQQVSKLRNARADAEAMAAAFRHAGYEVELVTDRTLKQMQADLRSFRQKIAGGDEVVLFFSGHGAQLGGNNYLLPIDVGAHNEDQLKDDALSLSLVLEGLRERKPRFTLAIVDACRDNPFISAGKAIGSRGLTGVAGASGQMVIYAAGEGQQALDRLGDNDPVRNGLFTRVFLREIAKPGVPIRDVLYRVRDEVATLAESVRHEQVPAVYDQVRGTFYFLPPVQAAAPAALPTLNLPVPPRAETAPAAPTTMPAASNGAVVQALRPGDVLKDCAECPEMVVIPAGSFTMGAANGDADERPPHSVEVAQFLMGRTELTQRQWIAVMGKLPEWVTPCGEACAIGAISWVEAQSFAQRLSQLTGKNYRLPSEAEWEYAARAGSKARWTFGDDESRLGEHAWFRGNSVDNKKPVATRKPNAFGLYDMHGNLWEWVQDVWHVNYRGAPRNAAAWMSGGEQAERGMRGGSFETIATSARSSGRNSRPADSKDYTLGMRIARTP